MSLKEQHKSLFQVIKRSVLMPEFICTLDYVFSLTHLIDFVLLVSHSMNIIFFDALISVRIERVLVLKVLPRVENC